MTPPSSPAPRAPSRELDAEIAERVMGDDLGHVHQWVHHTTLDDGYGASDGWYCSICYPNGYEGVLMLSDPRNDPRAYEVRRKPRPYSSDISAAWTVVEKLERRGCKVTYRTTGPREGLCRVEIDVPPPDLKGPSALYAANAKTAPLAICLAALKLSPPRAPLEGE